MNEIINNDVWDIRDLIGRFEEIEADLLTTFNEQQEIEGDDTTTDDPEDSAFIEWAAQTTHDDAEEYLQIKAVLVELCGNGGDEQWRGDWYPVTMIRDGRAFEEYMDEMLEDCGDIPRDIPSYIRIEIDYDLLKTDYSEIEIDGETYLFR
jgi:hypothetical protein